MSHRFQLTILRLPVHEHPEDECRGLGPHYSRPQDHVGHAVGRSPGVCSRLKHTHEPCAREKVAVESFKKAFLLYLHEAGHPEGTEMLMSEEEFNQARDDPICRARLTIKGCRETEMMPLGDWSIKVCIAVRMRTKLTFQPVLGRRPST